MASTTGSDPEWTAVKVRSTFIEYVPPLIELTSINP